MTDDTNKPRNDDPETFADIHAARQSHDAENTDHPRESLDDAQQREIEKLRAELLCWKRSFSGHVYVKDEDYSALCLERDILRYTNQRLTEQVAELRKDHERLNWLEEQAKKSRTGISFDYCLDVEDGHVIEKGFRFMRRHHLGERHNGIRESIDAEASAFANSQPKP